MPASTLPLTGIRIADFSWVGAGPFMTKPLADHGAEVIKVESRTRTDVIRSMPPFRHRIAGVDRSGYFANRNSSKKSICLDLRDEFGRELALRLIAKSDIVVNNFTPGTMDRLGVGYAAARAVRGDIIYLEMPMQGNAGPHKGFRGYGLSIGAVGGLLGLSGYPDRLPVGTGTNYPDHVPNPLHGAIALLAALRHRRHTGQGSYIELAQLESTINAIGPAMVAAANGLPVERMGNADLEAAPSGVYPCAGTDAWCTITVTGDAQWAKCASVLDAADLAEAGSGFESVGLRRRNRAELDNEISTRTARFQSFELAEALCEAGIPAAAVANSEDLMCRDPQLRARGHFVSLDHPVMGPSIYNNIPYRLGRTPGRLRSAAPMLGAHSREVCTALLGVSTAEYEHAHAEGVLG
ncbi:CoA transferase [Nocardia sp. NPDC052112]|uniref:CaiB/BaiF CoA transferase family protein n=1 Tax=Nocardia sp. NPDC052112 TaxID=3155646 RepID=UPI0034165140